MKEYSYTINFPTVIGSSQLLSFTIPPLTGTTLINFVISGVDSTVNNYKKICYTIDNSNIFTLQPCLTSSVLNKQFRSLFSSTSSLTTSYNVYLSAIRNTLIIDTCVLYIAIYQQSIVNLTLVNAVAFDNENSSGNVLLTFEEGTDIVNFILPGNTTTVN